MATQIYCTKAEIEAIWPAGSLLASVDDDASGTLSATELSYIDRAIERAANFINARLEMRYRLSDLAANTWCRDANAAISAYWLSTRRGAAAPAQLQQQYDAYVAALADIVSGRIKLPEQAESFDVTPGVSNFSLRMEEGYVPSRIADNPHLDGEAYRESLLHLPTVERERLMNGDWSVQEQGQFRKDWLRYFVEAPAGSADSCASGQVELLEQDGKILATIPEGTCWRFVTIDPAGTAEERAAESRGRGASWSVVQVWDQPRRELSKFLLLRYQERGRLEFAALCALVLKVKALYRPAKIFVEGEKLGAALCSTLKGRIPIESLPIGIKGKVERAATLITKMERGEVFLPRYESAWRRKFEAELLSWTGARSEPADQIDAAAYAAVVGERREGEVVRLMR